MLKCLQQEAIRAAYSTDPLLEFALGHARNPPHAAIAVPDLRGEPSLHRSHCKNRFIVARRFDHSIARYSAVRFDTIDLVLSHASLPMEP